MMEGRPRRRPPLWLFLLVLLAAVSIWAWRLRSGAPAGETEAHLAAGPQFEDPVRLVFETAGDSIVVVSTATGYTIVHPVHDLASTLRVKDVARNAMLLAPSRSLHEPPERFGLVPPQHRLRLVAPSGAVWSIAMGDSSAVGSEVYAQLGELGSPVVLIREFTARHYFAPDVDALRDPTALPLSSPVIDSLHVIVSGASLRARRLAADHWEAIEPAGIGLDPLPINRVLRELRGPGMTGFDANLTPADAGLDPPRARW
ncbi:MAG: hypothetical protein KC729_09805, partial [Candidatus Eisenbacteria bacterium]|nr:hypothetical protein [Candidatus Eisenbacteria bacterium]